MTKDKAKDEPIAWMYLEPENKFGLVHVDEYDYKQFPEEDEWIPVYKHPQPTRNEVLEEVAKRFDAMTALGDTAASFAVYVRDMKL